MNGIFLHCFLHIRDAIEVMNISTPMFRSSVRELRSIMFGHILSADIIECVLNPITVSDNKNIPTVYISSTFILYLRNIKILLICGQMLTFTVLRC